MSRSGKGQTGLVVEDKANIKRKNYVNVVASNSEGSTIGTHVKAGGDLTLTETGGFSFVGDIPKENKFLENLAATFAHSTSAEKKKERKKKKKHSKIDVAGSSKSCGSRKREGCRSSERRSAKQGRKLSDKADRISVNVVSETMKLNLHFGFGTDETFGDVAARVAREEEKEVELQDKNGNILTCGTKLSEHRDLNGGIKVFAVELVKQYSVSRTAAR